MTHVETEKQGDKWMTKSWPFFAAVWKRTDLAPHIYPDFSQELVIQLEALRKQEDLKEKNMELKVALEMEGKKNKKG